MDTTGKACLEFWTTAPKKGMVKANTAQMYRVALSQVFGGVIENWQDLDMSKIDQEDVFTRFLNLKGTKFKPESLGTYKSRFQRAISTFLDYASNPTGFRPKGSSLSRKPSAKPSNGNGNHVETPPAATQQPPVAGRANLVEYPFPLREGRFAFLRLPSDLTAGDVKRLTAYLNTLALEDA